MSKAVIRLDVPDWQIGKDVSVYFPDTMIKKGKCEEDIVRCKDCKYWDNGYLNYDVHQWLPCMEIKKGSETMGEKDELHYKLYYKKDGEFHEINGLEPVTIVEDSVEVSTEFMGSLRDMQITFTLRNRDRRKFKKSIRAGVNNVRRRTRRRKRQKERSRRRSVK